MATLTRQDFHFDLPPELIAQEPPLVRGTSRLLALEGREELPRDLVFTDLVRLLAPGDVLVRNNTRVMPARLRGRKATGGAVELLLERMSGARRFTAQLRASKGARPGQTIELPGGAVATVVDRDGEFVVLELDRPVGDYLEQHGDLPLPPYIRRAPTVADRERYQTVYAREPGAVAAPTAGLHFDEALFAAIAARGVEIAEVTLHVGAGTFQPLRTDDLERHQLHA
jgi:S-adenosylmethionine:tRNA ribosyltransferase-isomerase